jgi:carbon starvation protein
MKKIGARLFWLLLALAGGWAYAVLALHRGEGLNSVCILVAALCSYAIGYRFYSKWIATRVLMLNDRRATPCEVHDDGKDFVRTNKWIAFGQHFAAISGPGPLVGPVLAAQFGYLPGTLWILIGVTLGGAVQDFVVLFASLRRDGKSLGQMVKEELDTTAGAIALAAILAIMIILLAVLALVVVKALAESPWGLFTVGATVPIAMFMGGYLRFVRVGKVMEASAIGVTLLLLAVWGGRLIHESPRLAAVFGLPAIDLAWGVIAYGLAASVLPVWLLLAPRGYLSTFMKLGTIFALALGIFLVLPNLKMPPVTKFVDGSGLIIAGKVFPFCFITIACGAISGFHTLIASGTTPKILTRESYARSVGYGAMCLESLVAIMAIIAACTLEPGVYFGMNVSSEGPDSQARAEAITRRIAATGAPFVVSAQAMDQMAAQVNEKTLFNRTGGAATLAAGMADIFSKVTQGRWVDLWYHFAIMFEALFILTTIDAGTRVGRYLLQDLLGSIWKPLGETRNLGANLVSSSLMVGGWGYFLIQGVRDPLGGVNSLWPLFGIANQLLAAIGLCLGTTIILKMQLAPSPAPARTSDDFQDLPPQSGPLQESAVGCPHCRVLPDTGSAKAWAPSTPRPALALLTLVPMVWLLAVTTTAGVQKIFHPDPKIGFLAAASDCRARCARLEADLGGAVVRNGGAVEQNPKPGMAPELKRLKALDRNNVLDAVVAGTFLALVLFILILSVREWILLLGRRKPAVLRESQPVWLPEYALREGSAARVAGLMTLALALAKEVSGQGSIERAQNRARILAPQTEGKGRPTDGQIYAAASEQQFKGFKRCC